MLSHVSFNRWFAMRIDFLMFGFISLTVLTSVAVSTSETNKLSIIIITLLSIDVSFIYVDSIIDAAILGLSVAYVFFLTDVFSFCVRVSTEVESNVSNELIGLYMMSLLKITFS